MGSGGFVAGPPRRGPWAAGASFGQRAADVNGDGQAGFDQRENTGDKHAVGG